MAIPASTIRGRFNWRQWGATLRSSAAPTGNRPRGGRRSGRRPGVEALEQRTLMAVTLVSANPAGQAGGTGVIANDAEVSDDGRFVVFTSFASDLAAGATDTNASRDVFIRDLTAAAGSATRLVSGTGGIAFEGSAPSISADGRFVAFVTDNGLVGNDNNGGDDVYVWDSQTPNAFALVSVGAANTAIGGLSPSISDNGRVVAFTSPSAANLVVSSATEANTGLDVFVRNLDTNATTLISATPGGTTTGNNRADQPDISGDGNFVAFRSRATDLTTVPDGDPAATEDVFRRAVAGTAADLVSVREGGDPAAVGGNTPSISDDGNLVAFASASSAIVAGDTGSAIDVFVRNMQQGATEVISIGADGAWGDANSTTPAISGDGNFVAFATFAGNLALPSAEGSDVLLKNRTDESLVRVSQTDAGEPASVSGGGVAASSTAPSVNENGTAVSFVSTGENLAPLTETAGDTDEDVFVWATGAPQPGDTTPPTAAATAPALTQGAATHSVTVTYTDNAAIDISTFSNDDITVTGPGGTTGATSIVVNATSNTSPATVTYLVNGPGTGGQWDAADNGTYTVAINADAVRDTAGNAAAAGNIGTFAVNVGGASGPGADLVATVATPPALPTAVVTGQKGRLRLRVTNQGDAAVATTRAAPVNVQLFASSDAVLDAADAPVVTRPLPLRLRPGQSRVVPVPFVYPSPPDGDYFILANIDSTNVVVEGNESNNVAASAAVRIAQPFVDLVPAVGAPPRNALPVGRRVNVAVTVANNGNVPASGLLQIDLFASADATADASDLPLGSVTRRVRLRNGRPRPVRVGFVVPANLPAGAYFITARLNEPNTIPEPDPARANNTDVGDAPAQAS